MRLPSSRALLASASIALGAVLLFAGALLRDASKLLRPDVFADRVAASLSDPRVADFAAQPAGSWLLAHTPWTEAKHRIAAVGADTVMARHLLLPPGSACLRLERRTWRDGQGVTWAFQTFPGDAYDLVARFQPTKA